MSSILIAPDDPARADITALLEVHAAFALEESPPDTCHFLDVAGLKTPDITFWSARDGETLLGVVALKALDDRSGEVKSMHVAEAARGKGRRFASIDISNVRHPAVARRNYGQVGANTVSYTQTRPDTRRYVQIPLGRTTTSVG